MLNSCRYRFSINSEMVKVIEILLHDDKYLFLTRPVVNIAVNKIVMSRVRYHNSRDRIAIVRSLWRHRQSIVTSLAECKPSEWDTASMCEDGRFYRHLYICCIMYVFSWQTVYVLTPVLFWCLFSELRRKIMLSWALKQFVTLFFIYAR